MSETCVCHEQSGPCRACFGAVELASELGLRIEHVENLLLAGLTPHEIRQCAGINSIQQYIDAFDLAIREKQHRITFDGFDPAHETDSTIMLEYNDPGGPIERDSDGKWIVHTPYVPKTGTVYRSKRFAAIGTLR
jgi:hypothetical protein